MKKEIAELKAEAERLRLEKETATLRAEIRALDAPWWRKGGVVAGMTTIVAGAVPATTAVQGYFQKQRELSLEESKQGHELALEESKQAHELAMDRERQTEQIRTSYLDRMKAPGEHLRTLRFLLATTPDSDLRKWADAEKKVVEGEVSEIDALRVRVEAFEASVGSAKAHPFVRPPSPSLSASPSSSATIAELRDDLSNKRRVLPDMPMTPDATRPAEHPSDLAKEATEVAQRLNTMSTAAPTRDPSSEPHPHP